MTADLESRLTSQETPVEYVAATGCTVTRVPSVCVKTKKRSSTKGNEFKEDFQHGSYQQSIEGLAKGIMIGFFLCLVLFLVFFLASYTVRKHVDCSQNVSDDNNSKCQKRFIGYYNGERKITEEQIEKLTHIIFNGAKMQKDGKIDFGSDKKRLMFIDMKNKARNIKSDVQLLFATDAYKVNSERVAPVMAESTLRKDWINSIVSFILEHQLDGVEIVYRWPETSVDEDNLAFFVRELRYKLEKAEKLAKRKFPYTISIYSRAQFWATKDVPLLDDLLNYASFFNVETYNFYAPWHVGNIMTGPQSPLYSLGNDNRSIDWTMKAYTCKIMKPSQLNVIIPFGGAYWKNVSKNGAQADDLHFNVGGTRYSGSYYAWRDLETLGFNLTKASWHNVTKTPYIWHSNNRSFLTFDDKRSMKEKMEYIISKNLGGVTMDAIDEDDDSNTLLNAVTSMNMCSGLKIGKEEIMYNCNKLA